MMVIFLLGELLTMIGQTVRDKMDNVYRFATMMKSSAYIISHSGFLFFTLLFRSEIIEFLHVLLSFNNSIHNIFVSYGRNFCYFKAQVSVLVTLHAFIGFLAALVLEFKDYMTVYMYLMMTVSVLSVNIVTVLFINLAVLLKRSFTRINTCLCELIQCAGEDSVGLYRQVSTVEDPQPLIEVTYNCDKSKSRMVHIRLGCEFLSDFVDLFNSVYSLHTLVLVAFYVVIFIYDTYYNFVGVMNVNKVRFGSVMWIAMTCTETVFNALGFSVLIYFCSSTTYEVRR